MTEEEKEDLDQWTAIQGLRDLIERVSRMMKIEWPVLVDDWEDIAVEITIRLVSDRYATTVFDMEPKARKSVMVKIANAIANRMRDEFDYFNGNFKYSTNEVRKFLEEGAIEHALTEGGPQEAPDWMVEVADQSGVGREVFGRQLAIEPFDIRATFPKLDEHHRKILVRRFVYMEQLTGADRMRVTRAVDALTSLMNRAWRKARVEHEGPGSRPNLSNGEAMNKSRSQE